MIVGSVIEVFHRTVLRAHLVDRSCCPHHIAVGQHRAMLQREVGHLIDASYPLHIKPLCYLLGGKAGHSQAFCHLLQLAERHSQKWLFIHHSELVQNRVQKYKELWRLPNCHTTFSRTSQQVIHQLNTPSVSSYNKEGRQPLGCLPVSCRIRCSD